MMESCAVCGLTKAAELVWRGGGDAGLLRPPRRVLGARVHYGRVCLTNVFLAPERAAKSRV
jgi:hypothetical protein